MGNIEMGQIPLSDLRVDERMWGPGAEPIVKEWLRDVYDPETMPVLSTAQISGRDGLWLLGWNTEDTTFPSLLEVIFGEDYARAQLDQAKALSEDVGQRGVLCPRCRLNRYTPYGAGIMRLPGDPAPPALSRADNKTYICSDCGTAEAMLDLSGERLTGPGEWPVILPGSFGQGRL